MTTLHSSPSRGLGRSPGGNSSLLTAPSSLPDGAWGRAPAETARDTLALRTIGQGDGTVSHPMSSVLMSCPRDWPIAPSGYSVGFRRAANVEPLFVVCPSGHAAQTSAPHGATTKASAGSPKDEPQDAPPPCCARLWPTSATAVSQLLARATVRPRSASWGGSACGGGGATSRRGACPGIPGRASGRPGSRGTCAAPCPRPRRRSPRCA